MDYRLIQYAWHLPRSGDIVNADQACLFDMHLRHRDTTICIAYENDM